MTNAPGLTIDPAYVDNVDLLSPDLAVGWPEHAARWATERPFYVFVHGFPMLITGRHDDVRDVLVDRDRFTAASPMGPPPGDILMGLPQLHSMDGASHDRLRKLLMPFFGPGPRGTDRLQRSIEQIVSDLLDAIADPGFVPTYGGVLGELKPDSIPLVAS